MESYNKRECPVYPNLRPLAQAGACSPAKPTRSRALNALRLILCTVAQRLAIRWLVRRDIEVTRKNSLSKFGANSYEKLTSTSPYVLQGLQMGLLSMHGGMYSRLNSWVVVEGNGTGNSRGPGIRLTYSTLLGKPRKHDTQLSINGESGDYAFTAD